MRLIDLKQYSDDGKQYYYIVLVSSNGQPLENKKAGDSTYDILQFINAGCTARIVDYLKKHYYIENWREWKYYQAFFHGTDNSINLEYIYKKYHKFFKKEMK